MVGATVGGMAENGIHTCIYFDDGEPELLCVCGGRGLYLVEGDEGEGMLVVLLEDDVAPGELVMLRQELAVSA